MTSMEMGPHDATEIPAIELPRHAQSALAAGHLDRYGRLFGQAQEIVDPQRRYWAVKRLIECGLTFDADAVALDSSLVFAAVATGAVEALERDPREPLLLEYAGVALCELWSFDAAEAMFEAVARLDPERSLETNMAELRRRRALGREVKRALAPAAPVRGSIQAVPSSVPTTTRPSGMGRIPHTTEEGRPMPSPQPSQFSYPIQ